MRSLFVLALVFFFAVAVCTAEIFFQEEFGDGWEKRWVISSHKTDGTLGEFIVSAGKYYGDAQADKGLKTGRDARFYQISAEIKEFSNKDRPLILQYSVKHEQHLDCGGGYVKLLPAGLDQADFSGDSKYNIMFGPDICGNTKRVHAILNHNDKNHLIKSPDVRAETDEWTHLYTLILNPNQTFEILIDNKSVRKGNITDNWDILPPKEILDPSVSKPADWVDEREIDDPNAVKPEGWDDIPKQVRDKDAKRPDDWDVELDGEWEAPLIDNPEYKGEWKAPRIPNPDYKGAWVHPKIPNPEFKEDETIAKYDSHKYIGIEIWQVKAGTIFDNFLVTDSLETAQEWAQKTVKTQQGEKEMHRLEKDHTVSEEVTKQDYDGPDAGVPDDDDLGAFGEDDEDEDEDENEHDEL